MRLYRLFCSCSYLHKSWSLLKPEDQFVTSYHNVARYHRISNHCESIRLKNPESLPTPHFFRREAFLWYHKHAKFNTIHIKNCRFIYLHITFAKSKRSPTTHISRSDMMPLEIQQKFYCYDYERNRIAYILLLPPINRETPVVVFSMAHKLDDEIDPKLKQYLKNLSRNAFRNCWAENRNRSWPIQ